MKILLFYDRLPKTWWIEEHKKRNEKWRKCCEERSSMKRRPRAFDHEVVKACDHCKSDLRGLRKMEGGIVEVGRQSKPGPENNMIVY